MLRCWTRWQEIEVALVDIDDTITNSSECYPFGREVVEGRLVEVLSQNKPNVTLAWDQAREDVHKRGHQSPSSHSRHLYIEDVIRRLTWKHNIVLARELHELYRATVIPLLRLDPGAKDFFGFLAESGIKIVFVSDMTHDIQVRKLVHLDMADLVHFLISSELAFAEKPDQIIFDYAFSTVWVRDPAKYIMIGDSRNRDVEWARNAGIPDEQIRYKWTKAAVEKNRWEVQIFDTFTEIHNKLQKVM